MINLAVQAVNAHVVKGYFNETFRTCQPFRQRLFAGNRFSRLGDCTQAKVQAKPFQEKEGDRPCLMSGDCAAAR